MSTKKNQIRARMAKTGESWQTAQRHVRAKSPKRKPRALELQVTPADPASPAPSSAKRERYLVELEDVGEPDVTQQATSARSALSAAGLDHMAGLHPSGPEALAAAGLDRATFDLVRADLAAYNVARSVLDAVGGSPAHALDAVSAATVAIGGRLSVLDEAANAYKAFGLTAVDALGGRLSEFDNVAKGHRALGMSAIDVGMRPMFFESAVKSVGAKAFDALALHQKGPMDRLVEQLAPRPSALDRLVEQPRPSAAQKLLKSLEQRVSDLEAASRPKKPRRPATRSTKK